MQPRLSYHVRFNSDFKKEYLRSENNKTSFPALEKNKYRKEDAQSQYYVVQ